MINSIAWSSDQYHLGTASSLGVIRNWDLRTRKFVGTCHDCFGEGGVEDIMYDDNNYLWALYSGAVGVHRFVDEESLSLIGTKKVINQKMLKMALCGSDFFCALSNGDVLKKESSNGDVFKKDSEVYNVIGKQKKGFIQSLDAKENMVIAGYLFEKQDDTYEGSVKIWKKEEE